MTSPGGEYDSVTVELSAAEAQSGIAKTFLVPPGDRSITVQIPPGVVDNMVFRLPGAGVPGPAGGPPRDIVVHVRVLPPGVAPPPSFPPPPGYASAPPPGFAGAPPAGFGNAPPGGFGSPGYPAMAAPPAAPRSNNRTMLLVAGGLAVVLLLGCVGLGVAVFSGSDDKSKTKDVSGTPSAGAPSPTAPPASATPVAATEYTGMLSQLDKNLAAALNKVRAGRSPKAVEASANALASAVRSEINRFSALTAPNGAFAAHNSLLGALEELASSAESTASAAGDRQVCAGSSAAALFSRATGLDRMRTAAKMLATVDPTFKVGTFLPPKTADSNRRPANGTFIKRSRGGSGQFKIENGPGDKAVSLVKSGSKKPVTTVYLRSKAKFTVSGVRDGTYLVYTTGGVDWDKAHRRFTRNCSFSQFDDPLKFSTTSRTYTIWRITLKPVVGGNARSSEVDPDNFPE